jgi:hypothetical protein
MIMRRARPMLTRSSVSTCERAPRESTSELQSTQRAKIRGARSTGLLVGISLLTLAVLIGGRAPALGNTRLHGMTPEPTPPTVTERWDLLKKYQPITYFHGEDRWPPTTVDAFLGNAQLERQDRKNQWTPVTSTTLPTSSPGCAFKACLRLNGPCKLNSQGAACFMKGQLPTEADWAQSAVYVSFITVRDALKLGKLTEQPRYLLRYFYFYDFDDWRSTGRRLWQVHEGDWEAITVGLSENRTPLFAAYSQHCSGTWLEWKSVLREAVRPSETEATHPRVWVALGSHANYFRPGGDKRVYPARCAFNSHTVKAQVLRFLKRHVKPSSLVDQVGGSRTLGPAGQGILPTALIDLAAERFQWARFPGVWSEGEILYLAPRPTRATSLRYGEGPRTPRFFSDKVKDFWHEGST